MKTTILAVDDSRAVRMIVKKAFKSYACDILEASNGAEGLEMAAKFHPDIILMDITMPVLDGVEMLTKLKADRSLRHIPVVMLTAEAGRQTVMKIAKIGVRDYIVKPFQESVLVSKVGRIVELVKADENHSIKKISDSAKVVVVDEEPAVIQQFRDQLSHLSWDIHGAVSTGEALDVCSKIDADLIVVSVSLPNDGGLSLFRILRSESKTKFVPIFGMALDTNEASQRVAQKLDSANVISKPIDFHDFEIRASEVISLNVSEHYYERGEDHLAIKLPKTATLENILELQETLPSKISDAMDHGLYTVVLDASGLDTVEADVLETMLKVQAICQELTLNMLCVGSPRIADKCGVMEEATSWVFHPDVNAAMNEALGV